jgi:hypothetical protein
MWIRSQSLRSVSLRQTDAVAIELVKLVKVSQRLIAH